MFLLKLMFWVVVMPIRFVWLLFTALAGKN